MDVLDAGVYVAKWEADIPTEVQMVMWGPLQVKEMGFDGWEVQDGGETGFIMHRPNMKLAAGYGTASLIMVNRLRKAFLTVYFGGYPSNVTEEQRRLDAKRVVSAAEAFLTRLAKKPVELQFQGETALVQNSSAPAPVAAAATGGSGKVYGRRMRRPPE